MITVHHLDNSRSQRVLWLLEELEVPYQVKSYKRRSDKLAPSELRAIHPLGKSPVLEDGRFVGRVIAETGAIFDYLLREFGGRRLMPEPGTDEHRAYVYWIHAAEGTFMTPLLLRLICRNIEKRLPFPISPIGKAIARSLDNALVAPNLAAHQALWEDTLTRSPWFAGSDFSAADIMMSFPVEAAAHRAGAGDKPHIRAWLDTIHARPAYARAIQAGGAYEYA